MNRVVFLLAVSVFVNYIDRSNLSVAAPVVKQQLELTPSQLGTLLSAFFWTYAGLQIIAGWVVDRLDVKWVLAAGFALWSIATAATGILHGFAALLVVRVIVGAGESVAFSSYSKIIGTHVPEERRGFANAMVGAGLAIGPGLGMLMGGALMEHWGWRTFFVATGLVSLMWLGPWVRWMPSARSIAAPPVSPAASCPGILDILRKRSAWGTFIGLFCGNYILYFLLTWLPSYLKDERHFSLGGAANVGGALFLLAAAATAICGRLADRWIAAGSTPTRVRKSFMIAGSACQGLLLVAAVLTPGVLGVGLLLLAGIALGLSISNLWAITQTLAGPRVVGRWAGIQLFFGNLSGAATAQLSGFLVERSGHYYSCFLVTSAIVGVGGLVWAFVVGPIEPVKWTAPGRLTGGEAALAPSA